MFPPTLLAAYDSDNYSKLDTKSRRDKHSPRHQVSLRSTRIGDSSFVWYGDATNGSKVQTHKVTTCYSNQKLFYIPSDPFPPGNSTHAIVLAHIYNHVTIEHKT